MPQGGAPSPQWRGPTPRSILHKKALASGWRVANTPAGRLYSNPRTGGSQWSPPLPAGWTRVNTPAGPRYSDAGPNPSLYHHLGSLRSEMPTMPANPRLAPEHPGHPDYQAADADKPSGSARPRPVVSAKGLMSEDTAKPRMSGGQQMLTTSFGIIGGAPVKKKTLLGA